MTTTKIRVIPLNVSNDDVVNQIWLLLNDSNRCINAVAVATITTT